MRKATAKQSTMARVLEEMRRELAREFNEHGEPVTGDHFHHAESAEVLCVLVGGADLAAGHAVESAMRDGLYPRVLQFFIDEVRAVVPCWNRAQLPADRKQFEDYGPGTGSEGGETTVAVAAEKIRTLELLGVASSLTRSLLDGDLNLHPVIVHRFLDGRKTESSPLVAAGVLALNVAYQCAGREALDSNDYDATYAEAAGVYMRELVRGLYEIGEASKRPFEPRAFLERLHAALGAGPESSTQRADPAVHVLKAVQSC